MYSLHSAGTRTTIVNEQQDFVLSTLEPEQLAEAKKRPVPRRPLKWPEILLLWCLRIYLLFMIAVVVFQAWTGAR
jgi:hypothetical protein